MQLRKAQLSDLPQITEMYKKVVANMDSSGVKIWNDRYPFEAFDADISSQRLYLLTEGEEIAAAFALYPYSTGVEEMAWQFPAKTPIYLNRLGVNTAYLRRNIGSLALEKAAETARAQGADVMRLFVVDVNEPAIRFYRKNGFTQATGEYSGVVAGNLLREFGYEKML